MDRDVFFMEEGIHEYTIVRIKDLQDADRSCPLHHNPSARSVIVFGTEIPSPVYEAPPKEKTKKCYGLQNLWLFPLSVLQVAWMQINFAPSLSPISCPFIWSLGGCRASSS